MTLTYPLLPISVRECPGSRESSRGQNPHDGFKYTVIGTADESVARMLLDAATPLTWGPEPLWKQEVTVRERDKTLRIWDGTVRYGPVKLPEAGEWNWEFDCTAETQHVTQAKAHVQSYPSGVASPGGAINVTPDGSVEGVDIYFPKFDWTERHQMPFSRATWGTYTNTLKTLTGKTNNAAFRGFAIGQVLFLGATGSRSSTRPGLVQMTFKFRAGEDATGLTIDTITGVAKKAWDYLWVRYRQKEVGTPKVMVSYAESVHVERVYDSGDFSLLNIDTAPPTY